MAFLLCLLCFFSISYSRYHSSIHPPPRILWTVAFAKTHRIALLQQKWEIIPFSQALNTAVFKQMNYICWSDGCGAAEATGLDFVFCCYQPLCVVSQQFILGFFLFHKIFNSPPPPRSNLYYHLPNFDLPFSFWSTNSSNKPRKLMSFANSFFRGW